MAERTDPAADSPLAAWLGRTARTAVLRTYRGADADAQRRAEEAIFRAAGWVPIAEEDVEDVIAVGPTSAQAFVLGDLAPLAAHDERRDRRLTVCYQRPSG